MERSSRALNRGFPQFADGAPQALTAPLNLPGSAGYRFIFWVADFQVFPAQEPGGVPEPSRASGRHARARLHPRLRSSPVPIQYSPDVIETHIPRLEVAAQSEPRGPCRLGN